MAEEEGGEPATGHQSLVGNVYQALAYRRAVYDTLMWQVPALSLTAQAFLFTIALTATTGALARGLAMLLSAAVAASSLQLMAKHRFHESLDARLLEKLERRLGVHDLLGVPPHAHPAARAQAVDHRIRAFQRASSFRLWSATMALFLLAALGVLVDTALRLIRA